MSIDQAEKTFAWLLDEADAGPRYLTLKKFPALCPNPQALETAREHAYNAGLIGQVLDLMHPAGYWAQPGPGYLPKYRSTVWALILLSQLGAEARFDPRLRLATETYLSQALRGEQILTRQTAVSGIDCLHGNMIFALLSLGVDPERLAGTMDYLACSVTGKGFLPLGTKQGGRVYAAYKVGPQFRCRASAGQPCGWAAAKVLLALSAWPPSLRTPAITEAIELTVDFLLREDPLEASWTRGPDGEPDPRWFRFGFPVYYVTDLLQIAESMLRLGQGKHPQLQGLLALIESKRRPEGWYLQEEAYGSRSFRGLGAKGKPSKWVTLRALEVLQGIGRL